MKKEREKKIQMKLIVNILCKYIGSNNVILISIKSLLIKDFRIRSMVILQFQVQFKDKNIKHSMIDHTHKLIKKLFYFTKIRFNYL